VRASNARAKAGPHTFVISRIYGISFAADNARVDILLVEDNLGDVLLARQAFCASDMPVRLHVARDGVEALDFLCRASPRPDIILLDLNLPKMDGRNFLRRIKKDDTLKTIPTVVLSTSDAEDDVRYCYRQHATCFIKKPDQWLAFAKVVQFVQDFWLLAAKLQYVPADHFSQIFSTDRFDFHFEE
jgi:chemotaxis family two-component system response regulator Rcp1